MFHDLLEFALGPLTRDKPNANSGIPCKFKNWYGVWMRVKTPHNHMVKALGYFEKWSLV